MKLLTRSQEYLASANFQMFVSQAMSLPWSLMFAFFFPEAATSSTQCEAWQCKSSRAYALARIGGFKTDQHAQLFQWHPLPVRPVDSSNGVSHCL